MQMKQGHFIHAALTTPKDPKKSPRCIVDVLIQKDASRNETAGTLRQIWVPEKDSQNIFALLQGCKLGQMIDLEPTIVSRQNRDFVDYLIVGVSKQ